MIEMKSVNNGMAMHDIDRGSLEQNGCHQCSHQVERETGSEVFGEITVGRNAKRAKRYARVDGAKYAATKNESKAQEANRDAWPLLFMGCVGLSLQVLLGLYRRFRLLK